MTASTTTAPAKALDEMNRDELVTEVKRLRRELDNANVPHPAIWEEARIRRDDATVWLLKNHGADENRRAVEILSLIINIHDYTPPASA